MKTFEEFEKNGGCPCCGEEIDLYYGSVNFDSMSADQRATCYNCGLSWYEIYRIIGYEYSTYQGEPVFVSKEGEA